MIFTYPSIRLLMSKIPFFRIARMFVWTVLAGSFVAYGYFLVRSVTHVVLREELSIAIHDEGSRMSELESQYLAKISLLSEDLATEMGLVPVRSAGYVALGGADETLTRAD